MTESSNERFNEPWHFPTHFLSAVCVRCPKCSGKAIVKGNSKYLLPWRPVSSSLVCTECSYTASIEEKKWYGAISGYGSRACGHCGYKWVKFEKHYSNPPKNIPTHKDCPCDQCGKSSNVEIGWQKDVFWGEAQDPYFGLDLYMLGTIDQNIFWCYNAEHASYLERYIGSTLRERGEGHGKYSVLSNLPGWVKSSKNREAVLRLISKFKK